jgi:hypothetical protein
MSDTSTAPPPAISLTVEQFRFAVRRSWREIGVYEAVRLLFNSGCRGADLRLP